MKYFTEEETESIGRQVQSIKLNPQNVLCFPSSLSIPSDPFSKEYYDFQMELYSIISKNDYNLEQNENLEIKSFDSLFPYNTENHNLIGNQLISIGYILQNLNLEKRSSILEFGFGWGHTTLQLALSGLNVTAVDINEQFCDLLEYRKSQNKLQNISVINEDMAAYSDQENKEKFDAILFFRSFHHCSDHQKLCSNFKKLLKPNGFVFFVAEPIEDKCTHFPYPWGIRIDGLSINAISEYKWMELGFESEYFNALLQKNGFKTVAYQSSVSSLTKIIKAYL